jgi:hypothetical protein
MNLQSRGQHPVPILAITQSTTCVGLTWRSNARFRSVSSPSGDRTCTFHRTASHSRVGRAEERS